MAATTKLRDYLDFYLQPVGWYSSWGDNMPAVKINEGDFVFEIETKEVIDGYIGTVKVLGVHVWALEAPRKTRDEAYGATRRRVAKAVSALLVDVDA